MSPIKESVLVATDNEEIISEDIPKMTACLNSIQEQVKDITAFVDGFSDQIKNGQYPVDNGISLLDLKYLSLLNYLIDVSIVMRTKIAGKSLKSLQSILHIIENRTVVEKIRPLEHKLRYQIDKLLTESKQGAIADNDPLQLKPGLDNLEGKIEGDSASDDERESGAKSSSGKYVPPHIAAMKYDEDGNNAKDMQRLKAQERVLKRSSVIAELVEEHSEAPQEISEYSGAKKRVYKERKHRLQYEEEHFTRVQLSKKQKYTERKLLQSSELNSITKFGDISALDERAAGEMLEAASKRTGEGRRKFSRKKKGRR